MRPSGQGRSERALRRGTISAPGARGQASKCARAFLRLEDRATRLSLPSDNAEHARLLPEVAATALKQFEGSLTPVATHDSPGVGWSAPPIAFCLCENRSRICCFLDVLLGSDESG